MPYLIIAIINSKLEYNMVRSAEQCVSFINTHYRGVIENCQFDEKLVNERIMVFEVSPNYTKKYVSVIPPVKPTVVLK